MHKLLLKFPERRIISPITFYDQLRGLNKFKTGQDLLNRRERKNFLRRMVGGEKYDCLRRHLWITNKVFSYLCNPLARQLFVNNYGFGLFDDHFLVGFGL